MKISDIKKTPEASFAGAMADLLEKPDYFMLC
jgi:hypothetical protein